MHKMLPIGRKISAECHQNETINIYSQWLDARVQRLKRVVNLVCETFQCGVTSVNRKSYSSLYKNTKKHGKNSYIHAENNRQVFAPLVCIKDNKKFVPKQ